MENKDTELKIKDLTIKKEKIKHWIILDIVEIALLAAALVAYTISMFVPEKTVFQWYHVLFYIFNPMWLGTRIAALFGDIGKVLDLSNEIWDLQHPERADEIKELLGEDK